MGIQHVLVLPFPAQGHVNPFMCFSKKLVQHGFKVTFVNTDFNHKRVVSSTNEEIKREESQVTLISVPDGLGPQDDRNDPGSLFLAVLKTMPCALEKVIKDINAHDHNHDGSEKITSIIVDVLMMWALEITDKLGIKGAAFCPYSAAVFAMQENIPKLIEDGIIDSDGFPIIKGKFELSPRMPTMDVADLPWSRMGDKSSQKIVYDYLTKMIHYLYLADWCLCNTTSELETAALSLSPKVLPIGPVLMESGVELRSMGQFWKEDLSCLSWLDQQPPSSVIYIAFGSVAGFNPNQLKELALGLDLTNRPFLWVVREDSTGNTKIEYPSEFQATLGKIVRWAPQQKVLSHPAIACFVSHCGWNSTIEGVSNGVPFLCWPYCSDQLFVKVYVCDVWKVGLGFDLDDEGLISRWEIKKKVDQLLGDDNIRGRSQKLKEMAVRNIAEGGQSHQNFNKFLEWLRE